MSAPIAIFTYNRIEHIKLTIESLLKNTEASQSSVFIFSDGAKDEQDAQKVKEVRKYLHSISGFASISIKEQTENKGLANSVISGVSEIIKKYGKIIVVEDDLILSPNFLDYMNKSLNLYKDRKDIFSISAYCAPIKIPEDYAHKIFLFRRINSWGWATWKNRWEDIDWEISDFDKFIGNPKKRTEFNKGGKDCSVVLMWQKQNKIDSWAIRFNYACYKKGGQNVYPVKSMVRNIGADGSGSHIRKTKRYETKTDESSKSPELIKDISVNKKIEERYYKYFSSKIHRNIINEIKIKLYIRKNKNL